MNNFFSRKFKYIFIIFVLIFVFVFQTVAYSAISTTMRITGDASARVKSDVRVTDFMISEVSSDSISYYEEFGKDHLMTNVSLPSSSSYIIYKVEVTNFGSRAAGIYSVTLNNSNLKYELIDCTLGTKIYDSSTKKYNLGAKQTFYIKISYKTYNSSSTSFDLKINFDFQPFYNVEYVNFEGTYQGFALGKSSFSVDLSDDNPFKIVVYVNGNITSNYSFVDNILTINVVSGPIIIEKIELFEESLLGTSTPVLDENMVPVFYHPSKQAWVVADISEQWYCYEQAMWANVIIVDNNVNYPPGTSIDIYDDAIKQWYVWIPQYLVITDIIELGGGPTGLEPVPESMPLMFGYEEGYEMYVHTAFYNLYSGLTSNDLFLPGFWVGKFTTTVDLDVVQSKLPYSCTISDCSRIGSTIYSSDLYDSRMIKNSQWAAIAYLSTSIYGKPIFSYDENYKEVYLQNFPVNQNSFTGLSLSEHHSGFGGDVYSFMGNHSIYANSSTTGNVYGVYDMVSYYGTLVAGCLSGAESVFYGYYDYDTYNLMDGYWDEENCTVPSQYDFGRGCIDHAMWDTANWYGDYYFTDISNEFSFHANKPYLIRGWGNDYSDINEVGIFNVRAASSTNTSSLRVVLDPYNMVIV